MKSLDNKDTVVFSWNDIACTGLCSLDGSFRLTERWIYFASIRNRSTWMFRSVSVERYP